MLNKNEFLVLTAIESAKKKLTQRDISNKANISLGVVNKTINELRINELLDDMQITAQGYNALEPYRVKRAIFIAAGFGSRMVPLTFNTPKPLIRVNGVRIIDRLLEAVVEAGIQEIVIVRGYLSEQFDVLLKKYPNIKFIENKDYCNGNNILSALLVKDMLSNAYVLEGDLVLSNYSLIQKYQYCSNYLGIPMEVSDDWCFYVGSNGYINKMTIGGAKCAQMVGISYWDADAGKRLSVDIPKVVAMPGGKERYWDQVALEYCIKNYNVEVRNCCQEDIVEIDSFAELKQIDKTYDI